MESLGIYEKQGPGHSLFTQSASSLPVGEALSSYTIPITLPATKAGCHSSRNCFQLRHHRGARMSPIIGEAQICASAASTRVKSIFPYSTGQTWGIGHKMEILHQSTTSLSTHCHGTVAVGLSSSSLSRWCAGLAPQNPQVVLSPACWAAHCESYQEPFLVRYPVLLCHTFKCPRDPVGYHSY